MKTTIERMILKWHQAGYSLDEIASLVPQVPKAEVAAIIMRQGDRRMKCNPLEVVFGIVLTVCLCAAQITMFIIG